MSRVQMVKDIYSDLATNAPLLALLGPVTDYNRRIYAGWPQESPRLSGNNASEGWLVFYEEQSVILWNTIEEECYWDFHVWATSQAIGEDALDIMDGLYHWRLAGQNSRTFGERNVLHMQRIHALSSYDDSVKLYRKIMRYRFKTVKVPFTQGAG